MTTANITDRTQAELDERSRRWQAPGAEPRWLGQPGRDGWGRINVGMQEREVSMAAGAIVTLLGLGRGDLPGLLIAGVGGALIYRGSTGRCPMYSSLGIDTAREDRQRGRISDLGAHVSQSFAINRSPEELYSYWRNFENLPRIMSYLEEVRVMDDRRSHWVAKLPLVGKRVEWDAEITADEPNSRIAWRSLPGSQLPNSGEVRFERMPGDRGTAVRAAIDYTPPGGMLGEWFATMFNAAPARTIREDLRNFKRVMETGEVPTIVGQPRGTCLGAGKREQQ